MEEKNDVRATSMVVSGRGVDYTNPTQFEQLQRCCQIFTNSDLVPAMYQTSATNSAKRATANCMIALDMSCRIGASPLMVMQNMYIVNGHPSWSSSFLIATINTCGRFEPLQFRFNSSKTACTAYTTAKGSDVVLEGTTVSIDMAKAEGWTAKKGSKWLTMPEQMLIYRAASFWIRTYAPELSMGIRTREENEDLSPGAEVSAAEEVSAEIAAAANVEEIGFDGESAAAPPLVDSTKGVLDLEPPY